MRSTQINMLGKYFLLKEERFDLKKSEMFALKFQFYSFFFFHLLSRFLLYFIFSVYYHLTGIVESAIDPNPKFS